MRDFDDGGGGDDADSEGFGYAEFDALAVGQVDLVEECLVAFLAQQGDAEVGDRRGEVLGDRLDGGAEDFHFEGLGVEAAGRYGIWRCENCCFNCDPQLEIKLNVSSNTFH